MTRVLVVDDDPALLRALRLALGAAGYDVVTATNGEDGLVQAARSSPAVVILDLGLPDIDGITVCRRIRGWSSVPIIVLSAAQDEERKVDALDGGADDYVTKPFGLAELEARIRTALRHRSTEPVGAASPLVEAGPLTLDLTRREARVSGEPVELTSKEFDLLAFLAGHAGKVCTHEMLLRAVWGQGYARETQYLHAYIHRLRYKLKAAEGVSIRTASGIGYVLTAPAPAAPPAPATGTSS